VLDDVVVGIDEDANLLWAVERRAEARELAPPQLELPVAVVPAEGRLEATATTSWFAFKDDVVIRVTPAAAGSRVDIRSKSRVGRSDLGANARRIRAFLAELAARPPI